MTIKPKYHLERVVPVEETGITNPARYRTRTIPRRRAGEAGGQRRKAHHAAVSHKTSQPTGLRRFFMLWVQAPRRHSSTGVD